MLNVFKKVIVGLLVICLTVLPTQPSGAILFSGAAGSGGGPGTLLTTMTLVNTSGSTQAANFVTDIFGHPFKKGDIPNGCTGGAPQFQLTNGTNVPFSEGLAPFCWSDGSLKWAPFMLRVPTSIAGSGSLTINILSGGSTPASSSRSLSDFATASTDLNVSVDGETLGNLSGTWVSDLNQGIGVAHTDDYHYMGGQAGDVWRVRASFRQSGSNHGQLEAYWYVQALQDNSGGLYGLRYLPRITQPWYNCDAGGGGSGCDASAPAKNWRGFSALKVLNGASVLRDVFATKFGPTNAKTFTWTQSGDPTCTQDPTTAPVPFDVTCSDLTSTANGFNDHIYIHLTNSGGALPQNATFTGTISGTTLTTSGMTGLPSVGAEVTGSGVTAGTIITSRNTLTNYTVSISQTVSTPTAMTARLSTSYPYFAFNNATDSFQSCWASNDCGTGAGLPLISNCTGTCTATAYPYVSQFSSLYPLGTTGKPDYIQAGGSVAADHTTRIQFNQAYWRSTKMVPPWNYGTVSAATQTSYTFDIEGHGPVSLGTSAPGERDDIGSEPTWFVKHFYLQDANSTQTVRTVGLIGDQLPIFLRSHTTYTIPVVNNTTYSGMPSPNINWQWNGGGSGATVGFTQPTNANVLIPLFNTMTFDHMPEFWYYPLLVFGEPQFSDDGVNWGSNAVGTFVGITGLTATVNGSTNALAGISVNGTGKRDAIINGTHYYGMFINQASGLRGTAWGARSGGLAAALAGGYEPAATSTRQYLNDNVSATYAGYLQYLAMLPQTVQDNGEWYEPTSTDGWGASWQYNYLLQSVAYTAATTENADAITFGTHGANFHKFIVNNLGAYDVGFYYAQNRTGTTNTPTGNSQNNPYITSITGFAIGGVDSASSWNVSWASGSCTFTMSTPIGTTAYTPQNGDQVMFFSNGTVPTALTGYTTYYVVNAGVGGTYKFGVSATVGGSCISQTDTRSNQDFGITPVFWPNGGVLQGTNGLGDGYASNALGTLRWLNAVGSTVDSTVLSAEVTAVTFYPSYLTLWNSNPKYTFCPTYTSSC